MTDNIYKFKVEINEELNDQYTFEYMALHTSTPMLYWFRNVCVGECEYGYRIFYFTVKEDAIGFKLLFC